ncbi:cellulase family glycosylhydrolase [Butyrivibrio sp.]|uniref:cellulase family glycosylhydrolase n=1 Tax=Butyrivibrio sp. TaxID=28121 RepID=UPI0025C5DAB2|nr:cellulase family glycosylhydrolase [Butyrivibrio sp.]
MMHNSKCIKRVLTVVLALFVFVMAIPASTVYAAGGTDKTAAQVVSDMTVGWNIGNSLDSYGQSYNFPYTSSNETYWGNPATTKALIDEVAKAGFNTVRIPVSWGQYTSGSDYKIPDFFMKRVKEVVDYCIVNDMYVILNSHHDINSDYCFYVPNNANKSRSEKYFKSIWTQIANEFKNYDYHLVFETMNEPRLVGHSEEWWFPRNNPSNDIREAVACINDYNQVALDAIRATGGNNATRCVMVPGYDASIEGCMTDGFKLPNDSASNRLILSVHAYIPYYFALASDTYVTRFDDNLKYDIDSFFNDLNSKFISRNVPVVVGETSATNRNNTAERVKWADYYWGTASKYSNVAMVLWDNNIYQNNSAGSDGECHRYIDRNSLQWSDPEIISAIMKHVDGTPATINGQQIPSTDPVVDPDPVDPTPVDPDPVDPTPVNPDPVDPTPVDPEPTPVTGGLKAEYTINNWCSGYQVLIKVKNESSSRTDTWTVKVSKSEVKIDSSWCVNIAEEGGYYVITPMSWNSSLEPGASVDFGIQGSGSIGTSVNVTVQ